jgi:hypothetical protein
MAQPSWRPVVQNLSVPAEPGVAWTRALDYVRPGSILKIEAQGEWTPDQFPQAVRADGDMSTPRTTSKPLMADAPVGALIGRIGSSSAKAVSTDLLFLVGRHCVMTIAPDKTGALYLGVNDSELLMTSVAGQVRVTVYEAL